MAHLRDRELALDGMRGIAALAVCLSHLRPYFFGLGGQQSELGPLGALFYFLTGLGHQAVVIFFVLSGYFVGGSVLKQYREGRFSWINYGVARLTRLYVVLVPCLFLTLGLDYWGHALLALPGYQGIFYEQSLTGPVPGIFTYGWGAFLANLTFLQTIFNNPCYGSNGALWSLAYEFWYYVVFPLLIAPCYELTRRSILEALAGFLILGMLCLGIQDCSLFLSGYGVWLLGALISWVPYKKLILLRWAPALLLGLFLVASKCYGNSHYYTLPIGIATALWVYGLRELPNPHRFLANIVIFLSEISYTLYLSHLPVCTFLYFSTIAPATWVINFETFLAFCGLLSCILVIAWGMWFCFERNTPRLRVAVSHLISKKSQKLL